jgi:hypothetical protein
MASRLALSEGRTQAGQLKINLDGLRRLDLERLLGIGAAVDEKELGQVRRRFAAAFHPDRVVELPRWVSDFFLEVLGLVNEACDRAKKKITGLEGYVVLLVPGTSVFRGPPSGRKYAASPCYCNKTIANILRGSSHHLIETTGYLRKG